LSHVDAHEALSVFEGPLEGIVLLKFVVIDVEKRLLHSWFVKSDVKAAELLDESPNVYKELSVIFVDVVNLRLGVGSPQVGAIGPWSMIFFLSPWISQLDEGLFLTIVFNNVIQSEDVVGVVLDNSNSTEIRVTASVGASNSNESMINLSPFKIVMDMI